MQSPCQAITPVEGQDFHLYVDADGRGMSVVVCQEYDKRHHPVAFLSRLLRQGEEKMSPCELYILSVTWAVSKFKWYAMGS